MHSLPTAIPIDVTDLSLIGLFTKKGLGAICPKSRVFRGETPMRERIKKLPR